MTPDLDPRTGRHQIQPNTLHPTLPSLVHLDTGPGQRQPRMLDALSILAFHPQLAVLQFDLLVVRRMSAVAEKRGGNRQQFDTNEGQDQPLTMKGKRGAENEGHGND